MKGAGLNFQLNKVVHKVGEMKKGKGEILILQISLLNVHNFFVFLIFFLCERYGNIRS